MDDSQKPDRHDESIQVIPCGAVVELTDEVLNHGIAISHPNQPLFKVRFHFTPTGGLGYNFELVEPRDKKVKSFAIKVIEPPPDPMPKIIAPGWNGKIIK